MPTFELIETYRHRLQISDDVARELVSIGQNFRLPDDDDLTQNAHGGLDDTGRSAIECTRDVRDRDHWIVTVRNNIGVLQVGDHTFVIRPKIGVRHFAHIALSGVSRVKLGNEISHLSRDSTFESLIATWLVAEARQLIPNGLRRGYIPHTDSLPVLRGRPNLVSSSSKWFRGTLSIDCEFDEFHVDTPINRQIKWALKTVSRLETVDESVRGCAVGLIAHLRHVGNLQVDDFRAKLTPEISHYRSVQYLADLLYRGTGRTLDAGDERSRTFLLYTPDIIEQGLRSLIKRELSTWMVEKRSKSLRIGTVNPDLLFTQCDRVIVGDVKYRDSAGGWPDARAAAQQAVFFAAAFQTFSSVICSFSASGDDVEDEIVGSHTVSMVNWDFRECTEPRIAEQNFLQRLREKLIYL